MEFNLEHCDVKVDNSEELRAILDDDSYGLHTVVDASMGRGLFLSSKKTLLNLRNALNERSTLNDTPTLSYESPDGSFENLVTTWMNKHAFQSAPLRDAGDLVHAIGEYKGASTEMERQRQLELQRNNLKRSTKPFYLNAPIGRKRR